MATVEKAGEEYCKCRTNQRRWHLPSTARRPPRALALGICMDCGAKGDFSQKLRARGQAGIDENRVKGKEQIAAYTGGFPHFMSRAKPKEARKTSLYALKT